MNRTKIEWTATHHPDGTVTPGLTSNPLQYRDRRTGEVVWACVKHSRGCANCYSEALALRYGRGAPFTRANMEHLEPFLDDKEVRHILAAKTVDKLPVAGSRCFLGDMSDVFGPWVPDDLLDRLFATVALRPDVTFQVLTKRPERMADYFADPDRPWKVFGEMNAVVDWPGAAAGWRACHTDRTDLSHPIVWPVANLHLGTSVEDQETADARIPHLLRVPARVRFLSMEPLLGPVNLSPWIDPQLNVIGREQKLGWAIVGGESGPGARPMAVGWVRSLVAQCRAAAVPAFVKQLGANPQGDTFPADERDPATGNRVLHVRQVLTIRDRKGGDMGEWPPDLRVREFPTATHTEGPTT